VVCNRTPIAARRPKAAHQQAKRQSQHHIREHRARESRHGLCGFEVDALRGVSDIEHADGRGNGRRLDLIHEQVAERRNHGAHGLRNHDVGEHLSKGHAYAARGLDLPRRHGVDARAQHLGDPRGRIETEYEHRGSHERIHESELRQAEYE
jgi:hypothetical protein